MIRRIADRVRALLEVLARLGPGSRALVLRLAARFGWGYVLGAFAVACYSAARYPQYIAWGLVAWCALAWAHAPDEEPDEDGDPAADEGPNRPDPADVADVVRDVIGTGKGALLTALTGPLGEPDTKAVRTVLTAAHIRIRPGVRTAAGNGPGVHRDDVPAPRPTPTADPVDAVAADQDANTNTNNKPTVVVRNRVPIIIDPADHRRHNLRKS